MNLDDILRGLALIGLGGGAVGAAVGWILKRYLDHAFAERLEQAKVRFSRLHELRATAIAQLYEAVVQSENDLRNWIYNEMPVGVAPSRVEPAEVLERLRQLRLRAAKARILLSETSWQPIEEVLQAFAEVSGRLEGREIGGGEEERRQAHAEAIDRLGSIVQTARQKLEAEFRELLGAG